MTSQYKHWKHEVDDDGIIWLGFDKQDGPNVLSREVLAEFEELLIEFKTQRPTGLIIYSEKNNAFIAGADIREFTHLETEQDAHDLLQNGQRIMDFLESLPFTTVAMIHGYCMGGGLELALACDYRVATIEPQTKLSLPEIKLGIHPGYGGSVRLTQLAGAIAAMDMMLTGRNIYAKQAKRIGCVDAAVPVRQLKHAARRFIVDKNMRNAAAPWWARLTNTRLLRPVLGYFFRRNVAKHAAKQHYPAPYALIDLWQEHCGNWRRMMQAEADSVAKLATTETARNLVKVFFLREKLNATAKLKGSESTFKHVHVIGAGVMGGDIAAWCAMQGYRVTLQDENTQAIANSIKRAATLFKKRLRDPYRVQAALDRLMPDIRSECVEQADVIIEAIFENVEAKQTLFKSLEARMKETALLATNTSSIKLETLGEVLQHPERLVGLHFFNPVAKMPLVEVIHTEVTDELAKQDAARFTKSIAKLPLYVKSSPGFLVNRVLMPYLLEAITILQEGTPASLIDKTATKFGMPMGPVHLADTVGLDVCLSVAEILSDQVGLDVPEQLKQMVAQGYLGVKSGRGFYEYKKGKKQTEKLDNTVVDDKTITDRLILSLLNEVVKCLREGVVASEDEVDAGIIFGTGFAPFRGGPINYINSVGAAQCMESLEKLQHAYGARFTCDIGWNRLAIEQ